MVNKLRYAQGVLKTHEYYSWNRWVNFIRNQKICWILNEIVLGILLIHDIRVEASWNKDDQVSELSTSIVPFVMAIINLVSFYKSYFVA